MTSLPEKDGEPDFEPIRIGRALRQAANDPQFDQAKEKA